MTMNRIRPIPAVATGLGWLATLPFVLGAAAAWLAGPANRPFASLALSSYAAVVIAFIGAIHWGLGFRDERPVASLFLWGVVPSIVAWVALLVPAPWGLLVEAGLLVACYLIDRRVYVAQGVDAWLPLRLRLTVVATLCCLAGAASR